MAVAIVQQARTAGTTATPTASLASTPTAGNLLVAMFATQGGNEAAVGMTDGIGGTWTQLDGADQGIGSMTIWYKVAVGNVGEKTIQGVPTGSSPNVLEVYEISGQD